MSAPRIGSLFSGYGGLEQGVQAVLGGTVAWHSEIDPGACKILAHRYPDVPNLGDIERVGLTYSDEEWAEMQRNKQFHGDDYEMPAPDWSGVEPVDVLTGGSPCQDVSAAGKRAGMRAGTRSGLWASMCDAIETIRPRLVVWENVRGVLSAGADSAVEPCPICVGDERESHLRALGRVVGDLSELGYVGRWVGLRASDVGAPHGRFRIFLASWPDARNAYMCDSDRRPTAGQQGEARSAAGHGSSAADTGRDRRSRLAAAYDHNRCDAQRDHVDGCVDAAADTESHGRHEGRTEPARIVGGFDGALGGDGDAANAHLAGPQGREPAAGHELSAWGPYGDAVRRWERLTRPAPAPTEIGAKGQPRLSPAFVEWMQGLPAGWVTDVPGLSRNEQLKALGNGVVPQQAAQALRMLLPEMARAAA